MLAALYRRFVIPAFEGGFKRRRTFGYLKQLQRSEWETVPDLRSKQLVALNRLLAHASANVPHFRTLRLEEALPASPLEDVEQLQLCPLQERETIIRAARDCCADNYVGRLIAKATGGSSGTPLHFYLDHDSNDRRMAAWHRGYGWAGAGLGTKQLYLWGVPLAQQSWRQRQKDRLYNRLLYRRRVVNTFNLNEDSVPQFEASLRQWRPDAIVAYTNPIYWMARAFEDRGIRPRPPGSIVVGAEKLHPFQREAIERVFQAPVFETYGSREFMLIGGECDHHRGLHLTAEHLIVEITDDDGRPVGPGEEGNVVVTDLYNYGMPFIRYVTGDRAVAAVEPCPCGRGLPLLSHVVGRQLDVLTSAEGTHIPGEFFPHLLKDYASIRQFQVVQEDPVSIDIKLVVDDRWSSSLQSQLERQIRETIGEVTGLRFRCVDAIPLTKAGKLQVVVNRCNAEQQVTARATR